MRRGQRRLGEQGKINPRESNNGLAFNRFLTTESQTEKADTKRHRLDRKAREPFFCNFTLGRVIEQKWTPAMYR